MTFHSCCPQPHPAPRRRSYVLHARRAPRVTRGSGIRLTNAGSPGRSAESGSLSLRPECPPPVAPHPDLRWIVSASVVDGFPGLAHRDLPSSTQLLSVARLDESLGGTCTLWSRAISGARWSRPAPAPRASESRRPSRGFRQFATMVTDGSPSADCEQRNRQGARDARVTRSCEVKRGIL